MRSRHACPRLINDTFYGVCGQVESAKWSFLKEGTAGGLQKKVNKMKQMFLESMRVS
jgi:hypothetical protein